MDMPFATKLRDISRSRFMQFMLTAGMVVAGVRDGVAQTHVETEQEVPPVMQQPDDYQGALETLKRFHPDVYELIKIKVDSLTNKKDTKNHRVGIIYTQPMCDNDKVLFCDTKWEELYLAIDDFEKDQDRENLGFQVTRAFEGYEKKSYGDTRGVKTIACGVQLTRPGKDLWRQSIVKKTLGSKIAYADLYSGAKSLNDEQVKKLTLAFVDVYDQRLLNIFSNAIQWVELNEQAHPEDLESNGVSIDNVNPVYFAFLSSMLYQSPASFEGDVIKEGEDDLEKIKRIQENQKETREICYPLLYTLCDAHISSEGQLEAFIKLTEIYAARLMRYYKDDPDKDHLRQLYSQRAALVISVVSGDRISDADLVAMQIRASHREQQAMTEMKDNPIIVLMGEPVEESFEDLLTNPLCQWEPNGNVMVIYVARGFIAQQRGNYFIIETCADDICFYKMVRIPNEALDQNVDGHMRKVYNQYFITDYKKLGFN
jgi:hypothetical protein